MRFWMLAAAALVGTASSAAAQDVTPGDWSGFYAGVYAGYGVDKQAEESASSSNVIPIDDDFIYSITSSSSISPIGSLLGEVRAGYNFQHDGLVLGVEGSVAGGEFNKSSNFDLELVATDLGDPDNGGSFAFDNPRSIEAGVVGNFTGRIGLAAGDWLLYGKGGIAVTHATTSQSISGSYTIDGVDTPFESESSTSGIVFGTTFAVGAETKVSERVSIGAEVGVTSFREQELPEVELPFNPVLPVGQSITSFELAPLEMYTAKVGVNYHF